MNLDPVLCLAVAFIGRSGMECAAASNGADDSLATGAPLYRNNFYGFQFTVPKTWTVTETNFEVSHYHDVFITVNSRRPELIIHELDTGGIREFGPKAILQQMQSGEVYISVGHFEGPFRASTRPDTVGEDLQSLLSANTVSPSSEPGLSETALVY